MSRLNFIWRFLGHYKYAIVIMIGIAMVGFVDENSFKKRFEYEFQIKQLKAEIERYETQYAQDSSRVAELLNNPRAITKIARERYFMKADNEDIYVLSDDETSQKTDNETVE